MTGLGGPELLLGSGRGGRVLGVAVRRSIPVEQIREGREGGLVETRRKALG